MFKVRNSKITFENRKEAINLLGQKRYRQLLKENKFDFNTIENDGKDGNK